MRNKSEEIGCSGSVPECEGLAPSFELTGVVGVLGRREATSGYDSVDA